MADGKVVIEIDLQDENFKTKLQSLGTAAQSLAGGLEPCGGKCRRGGSDAGCQCSQLHFRRRPSAGRRQGGSRDPCGHRTSDRGGQGGKHQPDCRCHSPLACSRRAVPDGGAVGGRTHQQRTSECKGRAFRHGARSCLRCGRCLHRGLRRLQRGGTVRRPEPCGRHCRRTGAGLSGSSSRGPRRL